MPANVHGEAAVSRSRSGNSLDLIYIIKNSDDDTAAITAALDVAPSAYDGYIRQDAELSIEPLKITGADDGWWLVRIPYSRQQWGFNVGSDSYNFDTSGGTQRITHSKRVAAKYPDEAADIGGEGGGPIGATASSVEGTDIVVPVYEWEETHLFSWGDIDDAYKDRVTKLTGTVNDATFRNCQAGEALFLGARGGKLPDNTAAITFRFAKKKNATGSSDGITIGEITDIQVEGWQYVDVIYETVNLGTAEHKRLTRKPKAVYIHDVYDKDDFGDLGI